MVTFVEAYGPDRIGRRWGYRSDKYATGYHRGLDIRKTDPTGSYSVETEVVAISDGVVDYIGRPSRALGPTIRVRRDAGGYEFHSHSIASVGVGTRTTAGTVLGRNARLNENPGQIVGVHDHIVFSDYPDGAWNTSRETRDPLPFIEGRLKENDLGKIDDTEENYQWFARSFFRALKWDVRRDAYGADAKFGPTVWDRFATVEKVAGQPVTDAQVKAIADAVAKAIGQPTISVDYAAIAKSVNDDAAKRMASGKE